MRGTGTGGSVAEEYREMLGNGNVGVDKRAASRLEELSPQNDVVQWLM